MSLEEKHNGDGPFPYWSTRLEWSTDIPGGVHLERSNKEIPCIVPGCEQSVKSWIDEYCSICSNNRTLYMKQVRDSRTGKNPFDQIEDPFQDRREKNCWDFLCCCFL
jgi:hypothetical protein